MKRILVTAIAALAALTAHAATLAPIQLLNPVGSASGQVIKSNGPSVAPSWSTLSGIGGLIASNNLSDLASAATARTNLGLTTAATTAIGTSGATIPLLSTANTWALAQTFGVRPTFNGATPWDSGNLSFATPPAIGGTTPAAGAFTTLSASSTVSGSGFSTYLAAPPAIGGTTPAAGAFTTLSSSSAAKLQYSNTSNQSIPTGAATTITGWTVTFDQNSNFNASTGTFTAPATAKYLVSGQITWNLPSTATGQSQWTIQVFVNSTIVYSGVFVVGGASGVAINAASIAPVPFSVLTNLTSGNTVVIKALQNTGSAQTINAGGTFNTLSINQVP